MQQKPTERFSKTVTNYVKYRPDYSLSLLSLMEKELGLNKEHIIGDIGSGTGKLSALFLKNGYTVYGVEPNVDMREAAEQQLKTFLRFFSFDGTAENTILAPNSLDYIVVGQAFHWFNIKETRKEFLRILKPEGYVLLVWNKRRNDSSDFMKAYHSFIKKYATSYNKRNLRFVNPEDFRNFFGHDQYLLKNFYDNYQVFDLEGLKGRYFSGSYALDSIHPNYKEAMQKISLIFEEYSKDGKVRMEYRTEVYYGKMK